MNIYYTKVSGELGTRFNLTLTLLRKLDLKENCTSSRKYLLLLSPQISFSNGLGELLFTFSFVAVVDVAVCVRHVILKLSKK